MRKKNDIPPTALRDYGGDPLVLNVKCAAQMNEKFRTVIWTGRDMQLTLMSIPVRGEIGVEMHADVDQMLCVESGCAKVYMGACRDDLQEVACVYENDAIIIPHSMWHNIVNVGKSPLKLSSLYAPPQHPFGAVHETKADAEH